MKYAVVTPIRDDAENLCRLGVSLAAQTVVPSAWVIVDNGSRDETPEVARKLAAAYPWVWLLTVPGGADPVRGRPIVRAFHAGLTMLEAAPPDVVVKQDADITMEPGYFERLLREFEADGELGMASGSCYELEDAEWRQRHVTGTTVWGASRAYRWRCLQDVLPLEERMGWDGIDEFKANARGWRTQTFLDLPFRHHRREGERDGRRRARINQGRAAYFLGYRPWYLTLRALYNTRHDRAALAMVWGYAGAALRREPRIADETARSYLRRQQSLGALGLRAREVLGHR
jgi:cellulose synthase/poly-beta-1,6-N-acetylglucosamine synthase-like glycosyltransferase